MILQPMLDWCREPMTPQEKHLHDQGRHRAVAVSLAFEPPEGRPGGRWAGLLDHYMRPTYIPKLPFLEEWLEGTLRPTGASDIHSDLLLALGFAGSESGQGPVAGLECPDIDGIWSEFAVVINNWNFAAASVVYHEPTPPNVPPIPDVPLADGTATLTVIPGAIEPPEFEEGYGVFLYALSPIWTV